MDSQPGNHYIALGAATLMVAIINRDRPWLVRGIITLSSAGLGHTVGIEVAGTVSLIGEATGVLLVTAFSWVGIEMVTGILSNRQAVFDLLKTWLGRGGLRK